ncbi:hypothetical protein BCH308197_4870 [Bacillus cereus H3081.97]|nr:hypothetical protein BCH308197_4870 [Bacillus cereus H3081.97]KKZ91068.1 hypothetical protein B4086_4802 [Bacillus cereus]
MRTNICLSIFHFNTIVTKNVEKHFFMTDYFVAILSGK